MWWTQYWTGIKNLSLISPPLKSWVTLHFLLSGPRFSLIKCDNPNESPLRYTLKFHDHTCRQLLHYCINNKHSIVIWGYLAISVLFFKYPKWICFFEISFTLSVLSRHSFSSTVSWASLLVSHTYHSEIRLLVYLSHSYYEFFQFRNHV